MTGGLAAAQIQERYESKDQMEQSWAFNTMFLFHTCFYILVKLGRKHTLCFNKTFVFVNPFLLPAVFIDRNQQAAKSNGASTA